VERVRLLVFIVPIANLFEAESLGWGPGPFALEGAGQDAPYQARRQGPARHIEAGPHYGSHHPVQEPVGFEGHGEEGLVGLDLGPEDIALGAFPVLAGHGKINKIMRSNHVREFAAQPIRIQRIAGIPGHMAKQGRGSERDAIAVQAGLGGVAGMEIGGAGLEPADEDGGGREGIDGSFHPAYFQILIDIEMRRLPGPVDARIRAARAQYGDGSPEADLEGPLQFGLDRGLAALDLPAGEIGPQVFHDESVTAHGRTN